MSLPYRWYASGTRFAFKIPDPGSLVAWNHAVWRVISAARRPEDLWSEEDREAVARSGERSAPYAVVLRPVNSTDDPRDRGRDVHVKSRKFSWQVYPHEHYPICAKCHEPLPCREQMAEQTAVDAGARMERYATPGVCPPCQEPISSRQKSITFQENLELPAGPPVTFHVGRWQCRSSAADYEKRWIKADPKRGRPTLSCEGHVTNHNDGTYECTELTECPGPEAKHQSFESCRCPDCHANGPFDCHPSANARLVNHAETP